MARRFVYFEGPNGQVVRVKQGFCWPAFLFGPLWAFFKRAWRLGLVMMLVYLLLVIVDEAIVQRSKDLPLTLTMFMGYVVYMLICGINGNRWLLATLRKRGFVAKNAV